MTILVCPAGAVRVEGGSEGRALLRGHSLLTPESYPGGLRRGRCKRVGEGGSSLEGQRRARARGRAGARITEPRIVCGRQRMKRGTGRGTENAPCTAPRGPGSLRFPTEIAALCLSLLSLSPACPVPGVQSSPLARPPSHPPARAARSAIWAAQPPPPALYISGCQRRGRSLAATTELHLLAAPDGAAGGSERALGQTSFLGTCVARFGPLRPRGLRFLPWRPFSGGLSSWKTGRALLRLYNRQEVQSTKKTGKGPGSKT